MQNEKWNFISPEFELGILDPKVQMDLRRSIDPMMLTMDQYFDMTSFYDPNNKPQQMMSWKMFLDSRHTNGRNEYKYDSTDDQKR